MTGAAALHEHLRGGLTTVSRCWAVARRDGEVMGFTDHDGDLVFEGITFRAHSGLSAAALQQSTGLSVDNTEALGALQADAIREEDIEAGRYDGAEVRAWLVNWKDVAARELVFRGHIGDLRRGDGGFEAELRGLTEILNQPNGRVYQKACGHDLGDGGCGYDLSGPDHVTDRPIAEVQERRVFRFKGLTTYEAAWFRHGRLTVLTGAGETLGGVIKRDYFDDGQRVVELWHPIREDLKPGDNVRLQAGCDKTAATCLAKFGNLLNFGGFPDLPNDDWSVTDPNRAPKLDGGSRRT